MIYATPRDRCLQGYQLVESLQLPNYFVQAPGRLIGAQNCVNTSKGLW